MKIRVLEGGLLTTVQDLGRFGYQMSGISAAGPMDSRSFHIANLLVDNEENAACLEVTISGPRLEFTAETVFAITGGDLQPFLNEQPVPLYAAVHAHRGDILAFRGLRSGCRCYIAFAGGIDVPIIMGSRSTLVRAGFGGYRGRKLQKGDEFSLTQEISLLSNMAGRRLPAEDFSQREVTLRVIMGPQDDRFTERGIETFLSTPYQVTDKFDRMGYRLSGEQIEHRTDANIISDGIALGAIQVPGNGLPIIMTAERQPTGGYTKIASVIGVDMPLLGQRKVGDVLLFRKIDIAEAQELFIKERQQYQMWKEQIKRGIHRSERSYRVIVNGETYHVSLQKLI